MRKENDGCFSILGLIFYIFFVIVLLCNGINPIMAFLWPVLVLVVIIILMIAV